MRYKRTLIIGSNIFTNKEQTQDFSMSGKVQVPLIKRTDYLLDGIKDNFVSLTPLQAQFLNINIPKFLIFRQIFFNYGSRPKSGIYCSRSKDHEIKGTFQQGLVSS